MMAMWSSSPSPFATRELNICATSDAPGSRHPALARLFERIAQILHVARYLPAGGEITGENFGRLDFQAPATRETRSHHFHKRGRVETCLGPEDEGFPHAQERHGHENLVRELGDAPRTRRLAYVHNLRPQNVEQGLAAREDVLGTSGHDGERSSRRTLGCARDRRVEHPDAFPAQSLCDAGRASRVVARAIDQDASGLHGVKESALPENHVIQVRRVGQHG